MNFVKFKVTLDFTQCHVQLIFRVLLDITPFYFAVGNEFISLKFIITKLYLHASICKLKFNF